MVVDEQRWRRAAQALARAIGEEEADALIAKFLDEPARREDVSGTEERLDARITGVEERLDQKIELTGELLEARLDGLGQRIENTKHEVIAVVRGELNNQFRSMLFGFVGLRATIGAFVIGLVRFGI